VVWRRGGAASFHDSRRFACPARARIAPLSEDVEGFSVEFLDESDESGEDDSEDEESAA